MGRHSDSDGIRQESWAVFHWRRYGDPGTFVPDARTRSLRARSTTGLVITVVALFLAVVVPVSYYAVRPGNDVSQIGAGTVASLAATPFGPSDPSSPFPGLAQSVSISAAPAVHVPLSDPSPPVSISVPALEIAAPVTAIGKQADNALAVPEDIAEVGWYRYGAAPGSATGSIVISGHVDSAVQGLGAMWTLRNAMKGNLVTVVTADHRTLTYRVVALEEFRKTVVPLADIFATTGPPRLTLVTCGGAFDRAKRSYEDNIVVTALPV